ncbi:MAG: cephalosporin hydroxylase family protein [Campylobacterota bacterium]|nr:cephalosporin hydroxylase family protein [Campylobacterota bacterium]
MNQLDKYKYDMKERVDSYPDNKNLKETSNNFFNEIGIGKADYVYNFFWLGVPIIQMPQDLQAMQEIIWEVKPDLIIETGVAWSGSLFFSASMLAILESCDEIEKGHVLGIDIDIRSHTKEILQTHPLRKKITTFEGSSIDENMIAKVKEFGKGYKRVMVFLDSNHTHNHVLAELEAYAPLVSVGSYCMVGDTVIEDAPEGMVSQRPWGKGNSPKSAVWQFLRKLNEEDIEANDGTKLSFEIDKTIEDKIVLTGSPDGYLKRI